MEIIASDWLLTLWNTYIGKKKAFNLLFQFLAI